MGALHGTRRENVANLCVVLDQAREQFFAATDGKIAVSQWNFSISSTRSFMWYNEWINYDFFNRRGENPLVRVWAYGTNKYCFSFVPELTSALSAVYVAKM